MQVLRVSSRGEVAFTLLPLLEVVISDNFEMRFEWRQFFHHFTQFFATHLYIPPIRSPGETEKKIKGYLKALEYGVLKALFYSTSCKISPVTSKRIGFCLLVFNIVQL